MSNHHEKETQRRSTSRYKERDPIFDKEWLVIILNDDVTTFDFVIDLLMDLFNKSYEAAEALALQIHKLGEGVAGRYSYETAYTKMQRATKEARMAGFPLELKVERAVD